MRHRKASVKFNRTSSHKDAMFRNMVTSLFKYDRIRTTGAKAKELSKWADHLITLAKKGDLHSRRQALSIVREKEVVHQLFEDANKKYGERQGGYTRIVKLGLRAGDAATMALIELIGKTEPEEKKPKKKKAVPAKKAEAKTVEEKTPDADEKEKAEVKKKKTAAPKKKKAVKKKAAPKKKTAEKKEKKTTGKTKQEKETQKDKGVKKATAAPKKKTAKPKKKAAPKKSAKKKSTPKKDK